MSDELKQAALAYAEALMAFAEAEKYGAERHQLNEARYNRAWAHHQMYRLVQAEAL